MFWLLLTIGLIVYGFMDYCSEERKQLRDEITYQKIEKIGYTVRQHMPLLMKVLNQSYHYDFQDDLFFHPDENFRLSYYKKTKEIVFKVPTDDALEQVNLIYLNKILTKESVIPIYIDSVHQENYSIIFTVRIKGDERVVDRLRAFTVWCRTKVENRIKK